MWCWFADPRAVYHEGKHKRTYTGWVNRAGDIQVGSYDHDTRIITTVTLKDSLESDDHANPAILIRNDRRLMVFYSAHGGEYMYYRISENPEDISSWDDERVVGSNTWRAKSCTYPNPIQLSKENNVIYLFWRGENWKPCFARSKDGINWDSFKILIEGSGAVPYVPYLKFDSDGVEKIHFAFTDGHPEIEKRSSIYYACYHNGKFYKANGSEIKDMKDLPINPSEADKVYDANISGVRSWIWDIAIDNSGNPVIVYTYLPEETDHQYRYARWNGRKWEDYEITKAGSWFPQTQKGQQEPDPYYSGGIILDHNNPSVVYLSKEINGIFEIEKWMTPDGGAAWTSEKITSGSKKNNVRPIVPRGYKKGEVGLIWMYGDYIEYTEYYTALKMR
ncbi:BNR-4 repeat-containing protein [bacterium]|nr:BNR-4 repeat-containing protein [bacterium]